MALTLLFRRPGRHFYIRTLSSIFYYLNFQKEIYDNLYNSRHRGQPAKNIKRMRLAVNKTLNDKDNGDELHWIEEELLSSQLFEDPTGARVSRLVINLLSDLHANTSAGTELHDRIGFSKFLLQKYPYTDLEVQADTEYQLFISSR
jgi:hypothetical protein